MLELIIQTAIRRRFLILIVIAGLCGLGIWNFNKLPIDAVPDITNVQVCQAAPKPMTNTPGQSEPSA